MLNWRIRHAELYKANRRSEARTSEPVCRAVSASQHLMPARPGDKEIPKPVRNDNRAFAFTLAEVLITLVIIGVIAALTIPNLMQKYQEQATVKKVQKFYSNLSNAYNLAIKENGQVEDWGLTGGYTSESAKKIYEILFKPYFRIAKNCGISTTGNCFAPCKYFNNSSCGNIDTTSRYYKVVLDDGSAIAWYANNSTSFFVVYDVNGIKGPNQWGVDYFYIGRQNGKLIPLGLSGAYGFNTYCKKNTTESFSGYGCTAWVIYKGNMDYLHCDGLTWDKHSCKDK